MIHTAQDRTPYTYLITHKPTGLKYYGCRYAKNCHPSEFWIDYFTSSKHVERLIKSSGKEFFSFEIRKVFRSIDECRFWESRVLKRIYTSKNYLNRGYSAAIAPLESKENPMFGTSRPDTKALMTNKNPMREPEIVIKMINTRKRNLLSGKTIPRFLSEIEKQDISIRMKSNNPMTNPDNLNKMLNTMKTKYANGHPVKGSVWMANMLTQERKRVSKSDLHNFKILDGWIKLGNRTQIPNHLESLFYIQASQAPFEAVIPALL